MSFQPVFLWTDAMIFLLLAVAIAGGWWIKQRPHLLLPWQRLFKSRMGMVSLIVLSLFVLVGLLDTLHYRAALPEKSSGQTVYAPEVLSVLDLALLNLRSQTEKMTAVLHRRLLVNQPQPCFVDQRGWGHGVGVLGAEISTRQCAQLVVHMSVEAIAGLRVSVRGQFEQRGHVG